MSIIQAECLNKTIEVFTQKTVTITGITKSANTVKTIGAAKVRLVADPFIVVPHTFHVIHDPANILLEYDGILGNDFFTTHGCIINFYIMKLFMDIGPSLPLLTKDKLRPKVVYKLNARSETILKANILNPECREGLVEDVKVLDGVYLSNAITKVDEQNQAYVSILNTLEKEVMIKQLDIVLVPMSPITQEMDASRIPEPSDSKDFTREADSSRVGPSDFFIENINIFNYNHSDRIQQLKNQLRTDHLNEEEKRSLLELCKNYNQIFHLEGDKLTSTNVLCHQIITESNAPIQTKTYRYPEVHKQEVNTQISKMLQQGIIRPSTSPWSSPLWVVPKKKDASGKVKWRIVIDYRKLNDVTVGDAYPLPNITDILDQLGHSKYFTTLDLANGFHQIKLDQEDIPKTAFSTPQGLYEYVRMPFGLKNAPATFQRLMNTVLSGIHGLYCFVYLDDIVIYANSVEDHTLKLESVFKRLQENNLKLQPDKCEFMRKEVAYLGHVITNQGVLPDPEKTKTIEQFPVPKKQKDIKSFLGLVGYYRRFIENFSKLTKPLTRLLKKDNPFIWTNEQQESFDTLRKLLISPQILKYPDFSKEFVLTTDASNFAIGAILSQGEIGKDLPIAYASRTLNSAEGNYNTTEKELLAIKWAVQHFRPYLYGRKFKIVTDHRPLTWLFNVKDPGSKLIRWRLQLEEYEYEIIHKAGKINSNVDCLSRIAINTITSLETSNMETYNDLQTFLDSQQEFVIEDFLEIDELLFNKKHDHIAYLTNITLDEENLYAIEAFNLSPNIDQLMSSKKELYQILVSETENQTIYHCIAKQNHYDKISLKELFLTLRNLRNELIKNKVKSIFLPNFKDAYSSFHIDKVKQIIFFLFRNLKIKIRLCHNKITTPDISLIPTILKENHNGTASGHNGIVKMYLRIKSKHTWPNMKKDIIDFVNNCKSCQLNKTVRKKNKSPMIITTTSVAAFERVAMDIVGPLPVTEDGNRFILTIQDDLTKFSQAFCIQNHDAETVAEKLTLFISYFGLPKSILTDQGSEFMSKTMKELARAFKIKQLNSTAYHPQTNGALERSHATLKDYLKQYVSEDQNDWDKYVPLAMFCYNTSTHSSSNFTPHELVFGQKPTLPTSVVEKENENDYDTYVNNLKYKLNKIQKIARENLIGNKEKSKLRYDTKIKVPNYKIGDYVLLSSISTNKLKSIWKGPYEIISINKNINNATIRGQNGKFTKVHFNRMKPTSKPKEKRVISGYSLRSRNRLK